MSKRRATVKDVARAAGVSVSTVSYALRNFSRISEETRVKVRTAAEKLGYRRNPHVAALMAEIGRGRKVRSVENLALVWPQGTREYCRSEDYCRQIVAGMTERAAVLGYGMNEFWVEEDGLSGGRLSDILFTRNIRGVVFAPALVEAPVLEGMDWGKFSAVVLGHAEWRPEMHRAMPNHYFAVRECLGRMEAMGCRRIAGVFSEEINRRTDLSQEASFLTHHPLRRGVRGLLRLVKDGKFEGIAEWVKDVGADGVLLGRHEMLEACLREDAGLGKRCRLVTLDWRGAAVEALGILFRYDLVAAAAVDLLVARLQTNEAGVPEWPQVVMMRGEWRGGAAAPPM